MGKIYIDTVKYVVHANFEIVGLVEKPDVVGALFGQTEGLLGEELDLRELQKNGRLGRIEVNLQARGGKSIGSIEIPSSLDIIETSIIAAAIETVDRVGPCEAKISVARVEDTRNEKRKRVVGRAKEIVKRLLTTEIPERKELAELVRQEVRTAEISTYGPEKLQSGPNLDIFESIILVEGRADVISLLKNDINNVIAIGGVTAAAIPKTVVDLCRRKEATLFVDGDRGGDIIVREVLRVADLDYVVKAPPGKEVEELSRKEILKALRSRIPAEQYEEKRKRDEIFGTSAIEKIIEVHETLEKEAMEKKPEIAERKEEKKEEIDERLLRSLNELEGTLMARIYDEELNLIKEIPVRDITTEITDKTYAIVMDGIITQRLIDSTENKSIRAIAGIKMGNVFRKPEGLLVYAKER